MLYNLRMNEDIPIKQYLDEFNSIIINLNSIDIKLDNEDQTLIALCLLSSLYETFIDTFCMEKIVFHSMILVTH